MRVRGASQELVGSARVLRKRETPAEDALWARLKGRQLDGMKFRQQYPIGQYVLDFCCPEHRLVVEVDGSVHDEQQEQDQLRSDHLEQFGYVIVRFQNDEVLADMESVLDTIRTLLRSGHSHD